MRDYGPFDKPYGIATKSGLIERGKGFLVLFESFVVFIIWALLAEGIWYLTDNETLSLILTIPVGILGFVLMFLSTFWVYFPEFKPEWRKRLTW